MPALIVRDAARQDVDEIFWRISADDFAAALRVFDAIEAAFKLLSETPGAGPTCEFSEPDLSDIRFWPVKRYRNYIVIYRPITDGVEVIRVIHAATDLLRLSRRL